MNVCEHSLPNTNLDKCLRCGKDINIPADFCIYCGAPLRNYCTNYQCPEEGTLLPIDAAYCPYCGSETIFLVNQMVSSSFVEKKHLDDDKLPF